MRDRLKKLIPVSGLNQKEFSARIGVSSSALTQFIKGQSKGLNSETLISIINEFDVNPSWLLTGVGEMFNKYSHVIDADTEKVGELKNKSWSSQSLYDIKDFEQISNTKWYMNLLKEQRDLITGLCAIKDPDILRKLSEIINRRVVYDETEEKLIRELKDLEDNIHSGG